MARHQRGSLRLEQRARGKTWLLRFRTTRLDGKRVEHKTEIGLLANFPTKSSAWEEVDRQRLNLTINRPRQLCTSATFTFREIAQHYATHELQDNQAEATLEKAHTTVKSYGRHLDSRINPRWGSEPALAIEPIEVELWLKQLKNVEGLQNPTLDKIRRVMSLVFKHAQRYGLIPRDAGGNPMCFVRQRTASEYTPLIIPPARVFDILLELNEPQRTLALTAAATALRISEIVALKWEDLDFTEQVINVRRAYVWGRFGRPKSKASRAPVPLHALLAGFLLAWREQTTYARNCDLVFPSMKLKGAKPLTANMLVEDYLRPAAVRAGVLEEGLRIRFGFHNFRHSLSSALVRMKCDPKVVQDILRHSDVRTTLQLYTQSAPEQRREAQGKFLELMLADRAHLLGKGGSVATPLKLQ
jgi:integrase